MTISKKKAKMSVGDQGGLLLAAVPIHSSIKERHKEFTDGAIAGQAITSLEDFSAKVDELASMSNFFEDEGGFFDAPKPALPETALADESETHDAGLPAAIEIDEDFADPVSIGGFDADSGEDFNFDDVAIGTDNGLGGDFDGFGVEPPVASAEMSFDELSPAEIAAGAQEHAAWDEWQAPAVNAEFGEPEFEAEAQPGMIADASQAAAPQEEEIAFEVMPEDEIAQNVEISDKIIKLSEQADEFDIGDDEEFAEEDFADEDHDAFDDEDFDGPLDDSSATDDDFDIAEPPLSVAPTREDDFDMTGNGDDGFGLEDFPHEQEALDDKTSGDDWGHLPSPAPAGYGDDDGMNWGSDYGQAEAVTEVEDLAGDAFTFEDQEQSASRPAPSVVPDDGDFDWDVESFDDVKDEPQVSGPVTHAEQVKPVDRHDSDISGFDLSSDIEGSEPELGVAAVAAAAAASRTIKNEGVPGVKFGKKQNAAEQRDEDLDEFTSIPNEGNDDEFDDLMDEVSGADVEIETDEVVPAKKKVRVVKKVVRPAQETDAGSKKKIMLYAGVAVAALVIGGGGFMVAKNVLGGSAPQGNEIYQQPISETVPAPQASSPQAPAAIPGPIETAPEQIDTPTLPVSEIAAPVREPHLDDVDAGVPASEAPAADPADQDNLFGDLSELMLEEAETPALQSEAEIALGGIASELEAAANGSIADLLLAAEPPMAEEPALDLDKALEGYAKIDDVTAFRADIDDIRRLFDEYRSELDAKEDRIATLEADLSSAKSQAAHAEQLALAQNEVLVEVVRLADKAAMAETLIVDLSQRIRVLEVIDPADRVAVERGFEQFDNQLKGLSRDVGMLARISINGSPIALPNNTNAGSSAGGGDAVFAEGGRVNGKSSSARAENVPSNAKKGDFVEGYGKVLDIIPTSDGSTLIVMENGSVIK